MADDQDPSSDVGEGGEAPELADYDETTTAAIIENPTTSVVEDYADEPIEDYVVNLVVNDQGGPLSPDLVNAVVTDINGNIITTKASYVDAINGYTTAVYDELSGNTTAITGGKRWWGWSTQKMIFAGLIALCILGIILAILFVVIGKKFKKNKRSTQGGTTTTTKTAVTKGVSPDPKYQPVRNA